MVPAGCGELAGRALLAGDHASGGAEGGTAAERGGGQQEVREARKWVAGPDRGKETAGGRAEWRWRGGAGVRGKQKGRPLMRSPFSYTEHQ